MKKFLIVFLAVVLTLSLCLVACKPKGEDVVSLTVLDTLELKVGETVDFNGHVKVVVNGEEIQNPTVTCELKSGDPNREGRCTYSVVFSYNGTDYSKNGFVNFHVDSVVLSGNDFIQFIENEIVWKNHVTVKVNNATVSNPTLTAVIKSGTVAAGNDVVYTVTYNHEGTDYTKDIKVTYTDVDPDDVDLIDELFDAENFYDSYTVVYCYYEVGAEDETSVETDKVYWDDDTSSMLYQIHYVDDSETEPQDFLYFLKINYTDRTVAHYSDAFDDSGDWLYKNYSFDDEEVDNVWPYGYEPADVAEDISSQYFIKVANNKYEVKSAYLQSVAEVLFANDYYDLDTIYGKVETTYSKIELETDGAIVTKVTGYATMDYFGGALTYDFVVSYTWSDIDETEVELPQAEEYIPPYATPDKAEDLDADQIAALTDALEKTYGKISYEYIDFKDDLWYSYMVEGSYTGSATHDKVIQFYTYDGDPVVKASVDRMFANNKIYSFYSTQGDYYSMDKTSTAAAETYYIAFADFGFTVDMFGWSEQYGVYVVKADALSALQTKVLANLWVAGGDYITVETFTFKLDNDNNVTEWYLLATCTYEATEDEDEDSYSIEMSCKYSEFDTAKVDVPYTFDDLTDIVEDSEMETNLNAALNNKNYQNLTIVDHGNEYTMYVVGTEGGMNLRVDGTEYNSAGQGTAFSKVYQIGEDEEGEPVYSEIIAEIPVDRTWEDVFFNVLYFNFEMLRGHLQYNAATDTYVCHVADFADFDNDTFAYYWSDFFGEGQTVDDIELTIEGIDNGEGETVYYVTFVRMYVSVDVTETDKDTGEQTTYTQHNTLSATLSNFGTTQFPTEEVEEPEVPEVPEQTEANED